MSILSIAILVFVAASAPAQQKIVRKELYKANIGTQPISTVDVREIVLKPKQIGGGVIRDVGRVMGLRLISLGFLTPNPCNGELFGDSHPMTALTPHGQLAEAAING